MAEMTKSALVEMVKKLLRTDDDLTFLEQLADRDLKKLVACIRGRVGPEGK